MPILPTSSPSNDDVAVATSDMCAHAFNTLLERLEHPIDKPLITLPTSLGGVFVTWTILRPPRPSSSSSSSSSSEHYSLRGCIGTLRPARIDTAISQYAIHAAFNDSRFDPIQTHELPSLKVSVSILSRFEPASDLDDWSIGVHGLILEFGHGRYSATYLPEVASEQRWTKSSCIQSLAEKAGFEGSLDSPVLSDAVLTRYQSTKVDMSYSEYLSLTTTTTKA